MGFGSGPVGVVVVVVVATWSPPIATVSARAVELDGVVVEATAVIDCDGAVAVFVVHPAARTTKTKVDARTRRRI